MIGEELEFLNCNGRWNRAVSPLNIMICSNGCFSLNYWLTKFIQEPKRYTRMCVEYDVTSRSRMSKLDLNPLDASDKKCN